MPAIIKQTNTTQLAAQRDLIRSHGLAIITHARLTHSHRKGGTGTARRQRRPHARTPPPDRIYPPARPLALATAVKDKKTLREATRPTRPPSSTPARDPARSDRDPEFPKLPTMPLGPLGVGGVARGLTSRGGRARRHVTPPRAEHRLPRSGRPPPSDPIGINLAAGSG